MKKKSNKVTKNDEIGLFPIYSLLLRLYNVH
jgi:hypothetical protein